MNRGGFSLKRLLGVSRAKSRAFGIPFTRGGRHRKIGRKITGGGCLVTIGLLLLPIAVALLLTN
jgi:hypothetical protein